jgi:hypothetical protein
MANILLEVLLTTDMVESPSLWRFVRDVAELDCFPIAVFEEDVIELPDLIEGLVRLLFF